MPSLKLTGSKMACPSKPEPVIGIKFQFNLTVLAVSRNGPVDGCEREKSVLTDILRRIKKFGLLKFEQNITQLVYKDEP